jgi:hypothetical protein
MVALNSLQMRETANGKPLLVLFALIDQSVNKLREKFSSLHDHRLITLL